MAEKLSPFLGPIFDFGGIFQGLDINFEFRFPKRFDPCVRRIVRAITRENPPGDLTCRSVNKKLEYWKNFHYISPICREARNAQVFTKFGTGGRLEDVITCFKFYIDRFRGFKSAQGRILTFSIDLAGRL